MKKPHEQEWSAEEVPYGTGARVVLKEGNAIIAIFPATEPTTSQERRPRARLAAAAPDMARAGVMLHARVAEAARSLPSARTAEGLAEMDTSVTVPSSIIREVFAALRKAGVLG